jgi:uncharacterized protein YecE (DUF72 family)
VAVYIGTSGWQYPHWRGTFYPPGVAQARWLEYYAARFAVVEVNNAFYRLPEATTVTNWRQRTPDDFVLAVKSSRYLTHIRRLRDPVGPVELLVERVKHLGPKLGPVLLQLPATFRKDVHALDDALAAFPRQIRVAFEPRHDSWHADDVASVLSRHHAALCWSDSRGTRSPLWRTTDWGYMRLHAGRARPSPCYGPAALGSWARRLSELFHKKDDVFVFFNNDGCACAPRDARCFAAAVAKAGLAPTRVPAASEIRLCGRSSP